MGKSKKNSIKNVSGDAPYVINKTNEIYQNASDKVDKEVETPSQTIGFDRKANHQWNVHCILKINSNIGLK